MSRKKIQGVGTGTGTETSTDDLPITQGFWSEFFDFIKHNRKWWLTPLIVALIFIGGLLFLAGQHSVLAPFIYTLF